MTRTLPAHVRPVHVNPDDGVSVPPWVNEAPCADGDRCDGWGLIPLEPVGRCGICGLRPEVR